MTVKQIIDEDFINYCKPSMFILFPSCTFKCEKECGLNVCQNNELVKSKNIKISIEKIVKKYIDNPITQSIVCGGLEPFDSYDDLRRLISLFRKYTLDDIVIYTGYTEEEIYNKGYMNYLKQFPNIIIKFGRFIPNQEKHFDNILGVYLMSENQYARKIT